MKTKNLIYLILPLFLLSCQQQFNEPFPDTRVTGPVPTTPTPSKGSLDFTKFVSIGNSLTAGFQAGALFTAGQNNSLPAIMATQFAKVGGGSFNQPSINSTNGYLTSQTPGTTVYGRLILAGTPPVPTPTLSNIGAVPNPTINPGFIYTGSSTQLNNFAVPGIQVGQVLTPATGNWADSGNPAFNPFYARFASNPGTSTILGDAIAAQPTFFMFWLGANDVLGYAVSGASNEAIFTSEGDFATYYGAALNTLTATIPDLEGIVCNVPGVTAIPFFKLVPYNAIPFTSADQNKIDALNGAFAAVNLAYDGVAAAGLITQADADQRKVSYQVGANPILMVDEDLNDLSDEFDILKGAGAITAEQRAALQPYVQSRPANSTDLVPLTTATVLGTLANPADPNTVWGVAVPVGDKYILTATEQAVIKSRTDAFNATIASVVENINTAAGKKRVALLDVYAKFNSLASQPFQYVNGVVVQATLAPPTGVFSEDGVHPNTRGYALAARWIIEQINQEFGSVVPLPDIGDYPATGLPQ